MVVFFDANDCLTKSKFEFMHDHNVRWPWHFTHFRLIAACYGCGYPTIVYTQKPQHFVVYNSQQVKELLNYPFFWCERCQFFAIYDHYTEDQCEYCV